MASDKPCLKYTGSYNAGVEFLLVLLSVTHDQRQTSSKIHWSLQRWCRVIPVLLSVTHDQLQTLSKIHWFLQHWCRVILVLLSVTHDQ